MSKREINEMLHIEKDVHKRTILKKLKACNKEAYIHMGQFRKSFKQKYREMWSKPFWKEARVLLREYFTNNGKLVCPCGKIIGKSFVLHHYPEFYKGASKGINYFTPLYVVLLCGKSCHDKEHKK